jgi:hypothetical protein
LYEVFRDVNRTVGIDIITFGYGSTEYKLSVVHGDSAMCIVKWANASSPEKLSLHARMLKALAHFLPSTT